MKILNIKRAVCFTVSCTVLVSLCACSKNDDRDENSDRKKKHEHTTEYTTYYNNDNGTNSVTNKAEPDSTDAEINEMYGGYGDLYVTDANGDRIFHEDGQALIYVTDADGNIVTNANGVPESMITPFVPISEAGRVEYFGYSIVLPEGWTITNDSNRFENTSAGHYVVITPLNDTYDNYYQTQRNTYDELAAEMPDAVSWTEDVSIGAGCTKVVRFTLRDDSGIKVMYFFENSGNLYKIWFNSTDADTILNDSIVFCKAINYKPYQYYPELN